MDHSSDLRQSEFLEGKRVIIQSPIECTAIHQPDNHTIAYSAHKHVVFLELGGVSGESERMDHAADHRLAQVQLDFEIVGRQRHITFVVDAGSEQEEFGRIAEQFQLDFYPGH